jgi:pectate disaccharide-lyase
MRMEIAGLVGIFLWLGGPAHARIITAAPNGLDVAAGTPGQPTTLTAALAAVGVGDTIQLRGGTYAFAIPITIARANGGVAGRLKALFAHPGEKPVLDFSSQPYAASGNPRGLQIDGSYWHVRGLEVKGSADNGIYVAGSHNIVESCVTHKNRDTGLQIGRWKAEAPKEEWPSDNLILNCESFDNYDSPPGSGENADGFACKLTSGPGNVFRGCVAHHNIDDGWDLFTKSETGPIGPVIIDQCIAYANGTLTDGTSNANGDRNGFKLGGEKIAVAHVVTRSVAYANGKNGFTWNSNPGAIRVSNNLAFDNAEGNFKFGDNSTPTAAVFTNNVSFWTNAAKAQSDKHAGTDAGNSNCWWDKAKTPASVNGKGLVVTAADFSAPLANGKPSRRPDGGLALEAFGLASGSKLINAGVLPAGELPFAADKYYGGAPDLGALELGSATVGSAVPARGKAVAPASQWGAGRTGSPGWLVPGREAGTGWRNAAGRRIGDSAPQPR